MAKDKTELLDGALMLGPVDLSTTMLVALPVKDYAKTGVILANERIKVRILHGDIPVTYTLSLYVQRDALNEQESIEVATVKEQRDAAKQERDTAEQERQSREKRAAFELGQEATMSALKNIGQLAAGVQALQNIGKGQSKGK